jgi:hypothetical protein
MRIEGANFQYLKEDEWSDLEYVRIDRVYVLLKWYEI